MANTTNNVNKTDASHESTWGASQEAKETWDRTHGSAARRAAKESTKESTTDKEDDK